MLDAVIKIGGGLINLKRYHNKILEALSDLIKVGYRLLVVAGGGKIADEIRYIYREEKLDESAAHWMAVLSMSINAYYLSSYNSNVTVMPGLDDLERKFEEKQLPILDPYPHLIKKDPLPHDWSVTSDSIAIYFANLLNVGKVILVKDVDGVYTADPKSNKNQRLLLKVSVNEIKDKKYAVVDSYCLNLLRVYLKNGKLFIVNGKKPHRIISILRQQKALCSQVTL